jgi:predicted esterase
MTPLLKRLKDKPVIIASFDGGYASCYLDAPNGGLVDKTVVYRQPRGKPNHLSDEQYEQLVREWETASAKVKSLYTTFFFNEFAPALDQFYRVDTKNRAVTGFSLGGFGALHYALEQPRMFRSISGLSSAFFDEEAIQASMRRGRSSLRAVLGDYETNKENFSKANQFTRLVEFAKTGERLPPIYQHCGLKDGLLRANQKMYETLKAAGYDVTYKESEGSHNWTFWKGASQGVIDFHWKHFQIDSEKPAKDYLTSLQDELQAKGLPKGELMFGSTEEEVFSVFSLAATPDNATM